MSKESLKVRIIRKAWEDPEFKAKLLADPRSAIYETFGIKLPQEIELKAVEETSTQFVLVIPPNPEAVQNVAGDTVTPAFVWN